ATNTTTVIVGPDGDLITITTGPTGSPNPVAQPNTVALNVAATDSFGHPLSFSWTANCPTLPNNGTFSPNANQRTPTWTPPVNSLATQQDCTMTVNIQDGQGQYLSAGYSQGVTPSPHSLQITSGPSGTPNPVASGGTASLSVAATDSMGHGLNFTWSA